jgi:hypothetical protein
MGIFNGVGGPSIELTFPVAISGQAVANAGGEQPDPIGLSTFRNYLRRKNSKMASNDPTTPSTLIKDSTMGLYSLYVDIRDKSVAKKLMPKKTSSRPLMAIWNSCEPRQRPFLRDPRQKGTARQSYPRSPESELSYSWLQHSLISIPRQEKSASFHPNSHFKSKGDYYDTR